MLKYHNKNWSITPANVGVFAFKGYLQSIGKIADVVCIDPLPAYLETLVEYTFEFPQNLDLKSYDTVIACDSVEHGFHNFVSDFAENTVTVFVDHHPDITIKADLVMIDPEISSTCELIYEFFISQNIQISKILFTKNTKCLADFWNSF